MKKQYVVMNGFPDGGNGISWSRYKICINFDEAKRELRKGVEKDRNGYHWGVFELVYAVEYEKVLKEVELEEIVLKPLEAVPGPLPNMDGEGEDDFDPFEDDED